MESVQEKRMMLVAGVVCVVMGLGIGCLSGEYACLPVEAQAEEAPSEPDYTPASLIENKVAEAEKVDLTQAERKTLSKGDEDPLNLFVSYTLRSSGGLHEQTVKAGWFSTRLLATEFRADLKSGSATNADGRAINTGDFRELAGLGGINWVFGNKLRTLVYALGGMSFGDQSIPVIEAGTRTFSPTDASIQVSTDFLWRGDEEASIGGEVSIELDLYFIKFNDGYFDLGFHYLHMPNFERKQWNIGISTYLIEMTGDPLKFRLDVVTDEAIGLLTSIEWAF